MKTCTICEKPLSECQPTWRAEIESYATPPRFVDAKLFDENGKPRAELTGYLSREKAVEACERIAHEQGAGVRFTYSAKHHKGGAK